MQENIATFHLANSNSYAVLWRGIPAQLLPQNVCRRSYSCL